MIRQSERIEAFDEGTFHFEGAWKIAHNSERVLLLSRNGTSLGLTARLCAEMGEGRLSEGLKLKLISHGFAWMEGIPRMEFDRKPRPAYFIIDLTERCNYDCIYCFREGEEKGEDGQHRLKEILEYISQYCRQWNLPRISIQAWGGEPLLEADRIFEIVDFFEEHGICASIDVETNGSLLDDALAEKLRRRGVHLGISLDGPEFLHNRQRRTRGDTGSYFMTMRGIAYARRYYGNNFGTISVVTNRNISHVREMVDHLVKNEIHYVKFNIVRDNRYAREGGLLPSAEQILEFYAELFELVCECWRGGFPLYEGTIQTRLENLIQSGRKNCCESAGCTGGRAILSFDRFGGIYPCEMTDFAEERIGGIEDGDLMELVERKRDSVFRRERRKEECAECPWWFFCRGGCTSRVFYRGECSVDEVACVINRVLYPLAAGLAVEEPGLVERMLSRS